MAKTEAVLVIMLCINIMLVVGGVLDVDSPKEEGGIISSLFSVGDDFKTGDLDSNFTSKLEELRQSSSTTSTGFTDTITMFKTIFSFIFDTLTAPLQLLFNSKLGLPNVFRFMVGLPLTILWIFTIIRFLRKGD
jgi:hypothetical protein